MTKRICSTIMTGIAGATLLAGPAFAEVQGRVGISHLYDDNLFRQPRNTTLIDGVRRSDQTTSVLGEVVARVHPGDFDGLFSLNASHSWYARNSNLNNFNYSAALGLDRRPGATIGVSLDARSDRRLSSFADVRQRLRNIQSLQQVSGQVTFPITPEFRAVVTPTFIQSTSSNDLFKVNDYRQYGAGVGVGWYSPIGNSVAVTVSRRHSEGLNDRFATIGGIRRNAPIDVDDTSADLRLFYKPGPFSSINGVLSYVRRNDKSVLNNDYNGPAGVVTWAYFPRESVNVQVSLGRRLNSQSLLFVDSVRTDFINGNFNIQVLDRVSVGGQALAERRRFRYDLVNDLPQDDRVDRLYRFTGSVGWRVLERLDLSVLAAHERRSSNGIFGSYRDNIVQASATVVLGQTANISSRRLMQ